MISTSPPFTSHLTALLLKRRYGLRWIADFRDALLGNPFGVERWVTDKIQAIVERLIFKHADALVTVTDAIADEWRQRYPQWAHKITVICNGYDPQNMFLPGPPPARDYRLIAHVGSLYGGRQPTILLAAMDRLLARGEIAPGSVRVRLVGWLGTEIEADLDRWHRLKTAGMLEWVAGAVPHDEALQELAEADSLLLVDLNAKRVGHALPAKIFEYVLCGRPILALTERSSAVDRTLARCGLPYVSMYRDDTEAVVDEKLIRFLRIPPVQTEPSRWFLEQFDGRKQTGVLAALLTPSADGELSPESPVHAIIP